MHVQQATAAKPLTDSMRMFELGVAGGRPKDGEIGVAPEWFYKGQGDTLQAPFAPLAVPAYAEDGGEEAEIAGIYLVARTPAWIAELAGLSSLYSLSLLDAPVTGSRVQAEGGQLTFLVGGDASVLERARPALAAMSKEIVLLGPVGSGARMKLINNFLCGVQVASLAEGLAWIERSGLDREQALTILCKGAPGSPLINAVSARMVAATYDVNFLLSLMRKDLRYANADAATLGVDLRAAKTAEIRFVEAAAAGYADKDMSAVIEPFRARPR
jgi:3-hydroxyisobutyrate dehydrogenase